MNKNQCLYQLLFILGDSYFKEKEHHLNTMVNVKGLPTLFITLSMAESKWIHLTEILRNTDNGDTLPTNRPFMYVCISYNVIVH